MTSTVLLYTSEYSKESQSNNYLIFGIEYFIHRLQNLFDSTPLTWVSLRLKLYNVNDYIIYAL